MSQDLIVVVGAFGFGMSFQTLKRFSASVVLRMFGGRPVRREMLQALLSSCAALIVVVAVLFFLADHFNGPVGIVVGAFLAGGAVSSLWS